MIATAVSEYSDFGIELIVVVEASKVIAIVADLSGGIASSPWINLSEISMNFTKLRVIVSDSSKIVEVGIGPLQVSKHAWNEDRDAFGAQVLDDFLSGW